VIKTPKELIKTHEQRTKQKHGEKKKTGEYDFSRDKNNMTEDLVESEENASQ
jgi:hypothetical protein